MSATLSRAQALALGIGNPEDLTEEELRDFFQIVYPLESRYSLPRHPLKEATGYLLNAGPSNFAKNANLLVRSGIPSSTIAQYLREHTQKIKEQTNDQRI